MSAPPTEFKKAEQESNRGVAFAQVRQIAEAIECFRRAIVIDPQLFAAHLNLGALLSDLGLMEEALPALETAARLKPDSAAVHTNLANVLGLLGRLDEGVAHCQHSLAIRPESAETLNALGNLLKDQGLLDEAIDSYARAALIRPDLPSVGSNHLYALHFDPRQTAQSLLAAHRDWNWRHAEPLRPPQAAHRNSPDPERRLRIAYVSPDFREHPVGRFILPLLQQHDRDRFKIFCYANSRASDFMTDCIRSHADVWRDIAPLCDEQAGEMIRADGIDILVDLTMHMSSNRLLLFARKSAPVQVTYLAYCSTTGLNAIDYRLTDPLLDPPGNDELYVERSVRLTNSFWCYQANAAAPEVSPLPAFSSGTITFSCLNNFCKITPPTIAAWAKLLAAIPNSQIVLHTSEGTHRDRVRQMLGVGPSRVRFVPRLPLSKYFQQYDHIDIALDPFPYSGGTTTCDALWMGVPVVSLVGQTAVSRSGLSILTSIGRGNWSARTLDDYLQIAVNLASDLDQLARIRQSLREEMRRSTLMNAAQFSRDVEAAYRAMWKNWCDVSRTDV